MVLNADMVSYKYIFGAGLFFHSVMVASHSCTVELYIELQLEVLAAHFYFKVVSICKAGSQC